MPSKTKSSQRRKNKRTRRVRGLVGKDKKSTLVKMFLEMLNVVKLYHWKTRSYAQHKATDELYTRLNDNIDKFVEILLGKDQSRIQMVQAEIKLLDFNKKSDFQSRVLEYRGFLTSLNSQFDSVKDTDLLNIRDEMVGDLNQFLYLGL
jgi:DNA-binding ferritin-like protein